MHHLKGHDNIVTLVGAFEDKANVHLVRLPLHRALPTLFIRTNSDTRAPQALTRSFPLPLQGLLELLCIESDKLKSSSRCLSLRSASACAQVMELCSGGELFDRIVARGHYT